MAPTVAIMGTRGYPSFYGGFETAVRKLAPYLADHGWDVVVYGRGQDSSIGGAEADPRIRSVNTKGFEKKSLSTISFGFTSAIDVLRRRPDVVLVMNVANGFWLPLLRIGRIPTLVNVDGIEWERAKWGRLAKWVFRRGADLAATHATRLVFDAREIGRRWERMYGVRGVFIPYGGESARRYLEPPAVLGRRPYVLVVARFVPENSMEEFFDAVPEIAERYDVVIVGSSGYGGALDERAAELQSRHEGVHWLGHLSDDDRLLNLWTHCGTYFHGHSVGGTNPALVQAMHCGAPIVARNTVYNREVLGPDGMFVESDAAAIAQAVLALMDDKEKANALSVSAVDRAVEFYTWDDVNEKYRDSLQALVGHYGR